MLSYLIISSIIFTQLVNSDVIRRSGPLRSGGKVRRVPNTLQIGVLKHGPNCTDTVRKYDEVEVYFFLFANVYMKFNVLKGYLEFISFHIKNIH